MNKLILLIFALFFIFVACDYTWKYINRQYTLGPREARSIDFATNAEEIRWVVECIPMCDFYFMTLRDFEKMKAGANYTYLLKEVAKSNFTGDWKKTVDIKKRLVVAAHNTQNITDAEVKFKLSQLVPSKPLSTGEMVAIILVVVLIIIFCIIIGVVAAVIRYMRGPSAWRLFGRSNHRDYHRHQSTGDALISHTSGGNTYGGVM